MDSEEMDLGELSDELFDFKHITWKITNALTLPEIVDYEARSPSFSFAGATWKLAIFPYGQKKYDSERYIDLHIVRLNFRYSEQDIFFKLCFITKQGKEFESYSENETFTPESNSIGVGKYLKKSILMQKKNFLVPRGILTVMCQIRTKKIPVIDRCCQIESVASLLESSVQISRDEKESSAINYKESPKKETTEESESPKTSICAACGSGLRQLAPLSANKTLRDLKELFLKQEDCDVTIKVKEQEFRAHKAILIARSPVFASTFRNDMKEKATGVVEIDDCSPSSFSDFFCFLYCGAVEILTTENVYDLFTAADKYCVEDLRSECLEFMKKNLSVDTFCETVTLALQHLEKELIDLAIDFFAKHLQEIIVTVRWQRFVIDYPVQSNEIMVKVLVPKK